MNAISPSVLPHPGDGVVTLNGLGLSNASITQSTQFTASSPSTIDYEKTGITGSFTTNQSVSASLLTGSTSTGSVVDNYGVSTSGPVSQTFNATSIQFNVYKPVFVNNTTNLDHGRQCGRRRGERSTQHGQGVWNYDYSDCGGSCVQPNDRDSIRAHYIRSVC